jgi:hypothetical protein
LLTAPLVNIISLRPNILAQHIAKTVLEKADTWPLLDRSPQARGGGSVAKFGA